MREAEILEETPAPKKSLAPQIPHAHPFDRTGFTVNF
jgi:hypothetical protein